MAKIYGLFGSMTGKLADTVMSVRNGEQIARKYQPVVYNPSTAAQVAQRAKLKLMSQLSAVLGSVIAIPRDGSVSSRNLFTKANIGKATYANDKASINIANIKLTSSVVSLPDVSLNRSGQNATASLSAAEPDVDAVVYVALARQEDNSIRLVASSTITAAGDGNIYPAPLSLGTTGEVYILAYGIRYNTDEARAKYGNLEVLSAAQVADLVCTRVLTKSDITLTETKGVYSAAAE